MFNTRRIRLMTKLARYEEVDGKEDIKLSKYYRSDYVRLQTMKTIVMVTIGYIFLVAMVAVYKSEYLIAEAVNLDYPRIATLIIGVYSIILVVYVGMSVIGYHIKYTASRRRLSKYFRMLRRLRTIHREEKESFTDDLMQYFTDNEETQK